MKTPQWLKVTSILVGAVALALAPALSAAADDSTTTTFDSDASQVVSYGTNWVMAITVAGTAQGDYVTATSGTVNVLVKGIPGNYVTGLPLTAGGKAFLSPPSSQPPLGAGTYEVTAVYVPSGTAYLAASQTATPATLTITPLVMSSSFAVNKTTVDKNPSLEVVTTVSPPNANTGIPDGTWLVKAKNSAGDIAFEKTVPLAKNPVDPVTTSLDSMVKPGSKYTISANFVPVSTVAGGYQVKNEAPQTVTVEALSLGEILSTPFAAPVWVLVAIGLGLALLIAAAIVLLVKARSRKDNTPSQTPAMQSPPTPTMT